MVVILATSGPDATISATIWNPPVAMALMKVGLALVMTVGVGDARSMILTSTILGLAVQAHTTVLPVVATVLLWWAVLSAPTWPSVAARAVQAAATIALLQAPWLIDRLGSRLLTDTAMDRSVVAALTDPIHALRPLANTLGADRRDQRELSVTVAGPRPGVALIAGATALIAMVRDPLVRVLAIGPLLCTRLLFAIWQGPLTENYGIFRTRCRLRCAWQAG